MDCAFTCTLRLNRAKSALLLNPAPQTSRDVPSVAVRKTPASLGTAGALVRESYSSIHIAGDLAREPGGAVSKEPALRVMSEYA